MAGAAGLAVKSFKRQTSSLRETSSTKHRASRSYGRKVPDNDPISIKSVRIPEIQINFHKSAIQQIENLRYRNCASARERDEIALQARGVVRLLKLQVNLVQVSTHAQ
jgi:hypothetical protein